MGILQTRIWLPQIPLSRFAPLCGTPNPGQKSGTGKSSGTRLENSSRITGHAEVISVNPTAPLLPACRPSGSYRVVARIEIQSVGASRGWALHIR
jgi:hypothetical protein